MKLHLYHQIGPGGEESAAVRQYLVENNLTEHIEFHNIKYDDSAEQVRRATGAVEAPVLIAGDNVVRGKHAILEFLKSTF